jgi:hypothetical protein
LFANPPENIDSTEARETRVQHQEVRFQFEAERTCFQAIAAFAYDFVSGVNPQNLGEHFADGGLVFNDDDTFYLGNGRHGGEGRSSKWLL